MRDTDNLIYQPWSPIVRHTIVDTLKILADDGQLFVTRTPQSMPPVTIFATEQACEVLRQLKLQDFMHEIGEKTYHTLQKRYCIDDCHTILDFGNYNYDKEKYINGLAEKLGGAETLLNAVAEARPLPQRETLGASKG